MTPRFLRDQRQVGLDSSSGPQLQACVRLSIRTTWEAQPLTHILAGSSGTRGSDRPAAGLQVLCWSGPSSRAFHSSHCSPLTDAELFVLLPKFPKLARPF